MNYISVDDIRLQIRQIDKKLRCLEACFSVISQPEMLDSVNLQILALRTRRTALFNQLKVDAESQNQSGK